MPELQPLMHEYPPTPVEDDPVEVLRNIAQDMAEAMSRENPEGRDAALRSLLLDQGAADYMGRHGDIFLRVKACEAAGHLLHDEDRAAVVQHLLAGERLIGDVHEIVGLFRPYPDLMKEFVAPLVAQVSFGASLLLPVGLRDAALEELLPETLCASVGEWGIAPVIAGTADAVSRMTDPALKIPRLRALLAPEARLAVERSGELEAIHQTARAAAELPADEMLAAWQDLLSLKVCEILDAQGSREQVMWAEFAVNAMPDGELKQALLNALSPSNLSSDPLCWRDHVTPTEGDGSAAVSVHWTDVVRERSDSDLDGSRSTSSATPPDTPRGDHPLQKNGEGLSGPS